MQPKIRIDTSHPMNKGVLQYLSRSARTETPVLMKPDQVSDAYYGQGSHPDVVERVWDQLGRAFPADCRCLVYGTPALVHFERGVVFAICNGTRYNLRLIPAELQSAQARGAKTTMRWSNGEEMNASEILGKDWIFGAWLKDKLLWCREVFEMLENMV